MRKLSTAFAVVAVLTLAGVSLAAVQTRGQHQRCAAGKVRAFAAVTGDRFSGAGGISSSFDFAQQNFRARYNCTGRSGAVRRLDLGVYQVWFPGVRHTAAIVAAANSEGTSASVQWLGRGIFQVVLIGPQISGNQMLRRDVPFTVAVY